MLTYIQINAAKPREKAWTLSDSQSLYLVIQPNGSKLWRFNYRFLDKQKKLHLGGWPTISLAEARVRRDEAKKKIAAGIDPALEKKRARIAAKYAAANTFQAVAEEWLVKCERDGLAPVTVDKIRWLLAKAYPLIGTIPIAQITPHEALAVLRKVEATGAYESARRMRSVLSRVFRYGVATVRCDKDVAADLRGAIAVPKVKHFAAITRPSEVGALLRAIDGYSGHKVTIMAMRLSPHVLLRPGELRQAEWTDIDFDEAIWFIPAERMKMRRPHRVPLSRQVIAMLKELHEHTHWWKYLFPCLGKALHRAGFRYRLHAAKLPGRPDIVLASRRAAIFVHGCFWHRHEGCHWCTTPASNVEFWRGKFERNVERDRTVVETLQSMEWRTAIIWECGLRKRYAASTLEDVVAWLRSDDLAHESALVRPKAKSD